MAYKLFPKFILRTPLLSYRYLMEVLDKNSLFQIFNSSIFQEAIYLASPILHKEFMKLLNNEKKDKTQIDKIFSSILRYFSRMSTRCTPFGLFAGCSMGNISNDNTILKIENSYCRTTRLEMSFFSVLYSYLLRIPSFRQNIKYKINTSLYSVGNKYKYVERKSTNSKKKDLMVEVDKTKYLDIILNKARNEVYFEELISELVNDDITIDDAIDFIDDLIDSQLIIGDLDLYICDDYLLQLINLLRNIIDKKKETQNSLLPILVILEDICHKLTIKDNTKDPGVEEYYNIITLINKLGIEYDAKHLFQVDIYRETHCVKTGSNITKEILRTLSFLSKITPHVPVKNKPIFDFIQEFYKRYEDRKVPLTHALDPDIGIGYPNNEDNNLPPLLKKLFIPQKNYSNIESSPFHSILHKKAIDCLSKGFNEIVLTDEDVENLPENWSFLPNTLYSLVNIIKANEDETLIKMNYASGFCAASLLSRFAHLNDSIESYIKDIIVKEESLSPDVIFAEIIHLPDALIGNIICRPHIRDYEILYLCNSDLESEKVLDIRDLYLFIKDGRLVLYSQKLKKEIIPRLTTAHNYDYNSLPIYHFLCDMQHQTGKDGLYFDWGYLENVFEFKPRVRYNSTILSNASWTIKISELTLILSSPNEEEIITRINQWRDVKKMPQFVILKDLDNELFVDWNNFDIVKSLFSIVKHRKSVVFKEFLFDAQNSPTTDCDNNIYTNECIVSFYKS